MPAADARQGSRAVKLAHVAQPLEAHLVEAGRRELAAERLRLGEPRAVDCFERREQPVQPEAGEVARVERRDREDAAGLQDAVELGERTRRVEQVDDEPHRRALEPAVLERQRLGPAELEADAARNAAARDLQHLRRRLDGPDLAGVPLGQRGCERPGAGAHVEHAPSAQVAEAHERVDDLEPLLVDRPQLVVPRRPLAEIRVPR